MTPNLEQPRTIEELRNWFKENGYEPARTRFFAGVDVRSPKAFGIYQDELGDYIVYKNKADGTRAIRYQGDDEEFAVHELYQRFQEEIINQQTRWAAENRPADGAPLYSYAFEPETKHVSKVQILLFIVLAFCSYFFTYQFFQWLRFSKGINLGFIAYMAPIAVMAFALLYYRARLFGQSLSQSLHSIPQNVKKGIPFFLLILILTSALTDLNGSGERNGYYSINNRLYYRAGGNWYSYNDSTNNWSRSYSIPSAFTSSDWDDYQNTSSHQGSYTRFESTTYYSNWKTDSYSGQSHDRHDDHDNDNDWSSNDWDSGYTDWNSDW